mgnify:CR=1 FL=1
MIHYEISYLILDIVSIARKRDEKMKKSKKQYQKNNHNSSYINDSNISNWLRNNKHKNPLNNKCKKSLIISYNS